ncbi:NAD-dependent epimerase/dehydratase family protein [Motilimonas sp. KMU-193]|uniref:NAD-dependent epimerase/dehydratase family protein n=1 Tax=Motilimonas sp. KMU-193 TaxID=3388668 RepID=UPI00396B09D1
MIALVLGATGLIGQHLLNNLLNEPSCEQIWVVGRRDPQVKSGAEAPNKITFIQAQISDFGTPTLHQQQLPNNITHIFCCLGSTLKAAGSKQNFIAIDQQAVINFAKGQLAAQPKAPHFLLVSALGANPQSWFFYNRVKGQLEEQLKQLNFAAIHIFHPCLLLGHRGNKRALEDFCQHLFVPIAKLFIGPLLKVRPIPAQVVAQAMLVEARKPPSQQVNIISNEQMHRQFTLPNA